MGTLNNSLGAAEHTVLLIRQLVCYAATFLRALFLPKAALAARLLAAESQLAACTFAIHQRKQQRPRFTQAFRLLWVILSNSWDGWREHVHLMQPATVKRWHTTAFRIYWRWKSRERPGRPPIQKEMQDPILKLSRENVLWGAGRIRDTLLLLGYDPPCEDTVRKYMVTPSNPREKSTTWLPFLRNHLDVSWAMDFFTVVTANFAFLYVFVVLDHGRRKVIHFATTYRPSMAWLVQQLREATPYAVGTSRSLNALSRPPHWPTRTPLDWPGCPTTPGPPVFASGHVGRHSRSLVITACSPGSDPSCGVRRGQVPGGDAAPAEAGCGLACERGSRL